MTAACPACVIAPDAQAVADDATPNVLLSVPELKCAACIQSVERALNAIDGVSGARVNLTMKRVSVRTKLPPNALVDALRDIGFDAYPFDLAYGKKRANDVANDLVLRLGVAGFAMMNVMLLSVAVWSGATDATRDLFHLISAAIALPATIFAAKPFFVHAWSALRVKRLNMDVPISLALILAAGMSLYESLNGGAHAYFDAALSLTFFLLIGRVLEHRTKSAARSAAEDLTALETQTARLRDGTAHRDVAVDTLLVGDVVQVATGMSVPVDGIALDGLVMTDRSFLTGESEPMPTAPGETVRAGEINMGAPFHLRATAVGGDTSLRQMAKLVETAENARNRYTSLADRAARIYAPSVHLLALITFIGWFAYTNDFRHALNISIAVLIITCPCALGLAVPAVATASIGRLFSLGFLVKSGTALERLAEVDTVVFDKTGTLTLPGREFDLTAVDAKDLPIVKALAQASNHPISKALSENLAGIVPAELSDIHEYSGRGVEAKYNGSRVALGSADWLNLGQAGLAFANGNIVQSIISHENLRDGARALARELSEMDLMVLSGDTALKTKRLAADLNIHNWRAGVTAEEKYELINTLRAQGATVAMMGDGINDTAALAAAHASIAPGSALDAARNAADVVLLRPTLDGVPKLFDVAKLSVKLSRQNFAIAAGYNAIAIPIAVAGFATPMLAALAMSASSLTVLLNALRVRFA